MVIKSDCLGPMKDNKYKDSCVLLAYVEFSISSNYLDGIIVDEHDTWHY